MITSEYGAALIGVTDQVLLDRAQLIAPVIRALAGAGYFCIFHTSPHVLASIQDSIVIESHIPVYILKDADADVQAQQLTAEIDERLSACGGALVAVENLGLFGVGQSIAAARCILDAFLSGGKTALPAELIGQSAGRARGKVAIVTGGAQGFGKGIAKRLLEEGACVVIADQNAEGARAAVMEIADGQKNAIAWETDVSDEESAKRMILAAVLEFGGLDIFINNAGINTPGSIEDIDLATFERICKVNYTAYFLGAKYASLVMKRQNRFAPERYSDIIQINSKSGIAGSNKNFAYAGSKFGGIGLTQSFALELAPHRVKVNSICPGNYFESPLWADPERGMFALYLKAGKVPGAKTIDDIRRSYEEKVPLGRGCRPEDLACTVLYLVEQEYETGQAVPVTGGQIMLK